MYYFHKILSDSQIYKYINIMQKGRYLLGMTQCYQSQFERNKQFY